MERERHCPRGTVTAVTCDGYFGHVFLYATTKTHEGGKRMKEGEADKKKRFFSTEGQIVGGAGRNQTVADDSGSAPELP